MTWQLASIRSMHPRGSGRAVKRGAKVFSQPNHGRDGYTPHWCCILFISHPHSRGGCNPTACIPGGRNHCRSIYRKINSHFVQFFVLQRFSQIRLLISRVRNLNTDWLIQKENVCSLRWGVIWGTEQTLSPGSGHLGSAPFSGSLSCVIGIKASKALRLKVSGTA